MKVKKDTMNLNMCLICDGGLDDLSKRVIQKPTTKGIAEILGASEKRRDKLWEKLEPCKKNLESMRHRLPYHEALISELKTLGFPGASHYLKSLIKYQDRLRAEHGPDTVVWNRPLLIHSKKLLDDTFSGLREADRLHQKECFEQECLTLLQMVVPYAFGECKGCDWWWLAEQIMLEAINRSIDYKNVGNYALAMANYLYGKFLFEEMKDSKGPQEYLVRARNLAEGFGWTAQKILNAKQDTIFIESSILLCKVLLEEAKQVMKYDIPEAIKLTVIAKKRAAEACYHSGETEALLLKGKCEILINDTGAAIISLQKALAIQIKNESPEGICEARVQLALAYIRHGAPSLALVQLKALMEYAQAHNLLHYIAQAYRYLGMYYISKGEASKATPLLITALNLFHEQNNITDMEQVRNFAAISTAQELLPAYTRLIVHCDKGGALQYEELQRLVRWKDSRETFWQDGEGSEGDSFGGCSSTGSLDLQILTGGDGNDVSLEKMIKIYADDKSSEEDSVEIKQVSDNEVNTTNVLPESKSTQNEDSESIKEVQHSSVIG